MRKSTLFISAVLTTFMLAVLFGVVSSYQNKRVETATQMKEQPAAVAEILPGATEFPTPTQPAALTPEQAASLAAQILGRTDLLSVETAVFNGLQAYLVKFLSGDMVYISPQGVVLSVVAAPPAVVSLPAKNIKEDRPRIGGGGGGGGDDDDHDDDHDD